MATDGLWKDVGALGRRRLTPKLAAALRYAHEYLLKFQEVPCE